MFNDIFKFLDTNFIFNKSIISLILLILNFKLITILNNNNKYKYVISFFITSLLLLIVMYKKTPIYLYFFIVITELTSLYLILIITININILQQYKNNIIIYLSLIYLVFIPTYNSQQYEYFNLYILINQYVSSLTPFNFILKSNYLLTIVILILVLTAYLIIILYKTNNITNKINILFLLTSVIGLINQIPNNLNLFTNTILYK